MTENQTHILDLASEVEPPESGITSKVLYDNDEVKAILFGFGENEDLFEHSAPLPVILNFVQGEASLTIGDESKQAQPGTWIHMPAKLKHSVHANTPVVMLLLMLKNENRP